MNELDPYDEYINYQKDISESFDDMNPSKVDEVYWLFAKRQKGKYPDSTRRSGKWLVFVGVSDVDKVWKRIKKATEDGRLGNSSKVSTMKRSPLSRDSGQKVICVYTYDWKDKEDVMRIRGELRSLGVLDKIPYKSNEDTLKGKYSKDGDKKISKYFE